MRTAAIVLAGGRSSRMGAAKPSLAWHGSTLLRRVTGLASRAVPGARVVVVRAPGQPLPALPASVEVCDDPVEGRGPVQGLAVGLAAVADDAEIAFVCSTDLPFLHPAFVRRVLDGFTEGGAPAPDVVLPVARGHHQPLAAGYRTSLAPRVAKLVEAGRLKVGMLFEEVDVRRLDDASLLADPRLARADPALESLLNVNDRDDYAAALARPEPEVAVRCYGVVATRGRPGRHTVRASTVGAAAAAVDLVFDRHVLAAINGDQTSHDGEQPLAAGDDVAFLSADAGG